MIQGIIMAAMMLGYQTQMIDRYINQDGKGADNHTNEFMDGYNDGYDSCGGGNSDRGSDDNENNNENNNDNENSQSQSQNQGIYICQVNGCVPQ